MKQEIKLVITDSGLGGLSICADLVRRIQAIEPAENVTIKYINAVPENDRGYNSMSSRQEKISTFRNFLARVDELYAPDSIYIACNSLSVIYPETGHAGDSLTPVRGIVDTGVGLLRSAFDTEAGQGILIFATPTTVDEGTYGKKLIAAGIPPAAIISQACPELANTISNDPGGQQVYDLILEFAQEAMTKAARSFDRYLVYLGCTHYGYRQELFETVFSVLKTPARIVNPNRSAYQEILTLRPRPDEDERPGRVTVEFITRYPIPQREIYTLSMYLSNISPETVTALQNFTLKTDLF
ncbi:MAG: hypothetical protein ABIA75_10015 [Candidatus Neomarinimicrobiota bacterium]